MAFKLTRYGFLLGINLLIPISIVLFAIGFFPYKPVLPGLAQYEALDFGPLPEAPFDRLVFVVVDALRSDFVYSEDTGFQFTQELIRNGAALPYTAMARSPTITMPRIKAITTGSIPSFVDVILNFDEADTSSSLAAQDTWLAQMKAKQTGKLLMFGDDTWLKLFPGTFDRADGTSSFFVADFTEVDNNVTRHIADELLQDDWNTMVLHYLGLDHIGHKAGPKSPNMLPKQREMDQIVQQMFRAMESSSHLSSTLLVLCGDHGMNEAGNHGASSAGETSPALVFMSPKLRSMSKNLQAPLPTAEDFRYYSMVEQSDIAPTLAALLGFPIPKNNLGSLIPEFLSFWSSTKDQAHLLMRNARQILTIAEAAFPTQFLAFSEKQQHPQPCSSSLTSSESLACQWQALNRNASELANIDNEWFSAMFKWLKDAQNLLSSMATNYDMSKMTTGLILVSAGAILSLGLSLTSSPGLSTLPLLMIIVLYAIMMFGSSYIEEEHHFWYWTTSAWLSYLGVSRLQTTLQYRSSIVSLLGTMLATRLVRGWNQTGQKFAGDPDIVKTFLVTQPELLWGLVALTYLWVYAGLIRRAKHLPLAFVTMGLVTVVTASAFMFKLSFTNEDAPELVVGLARLFKDTLSVGSLTSQVRLAFQGIALLCGVAIISCFRGDLEYSAQHRQGAYLDFLLPLYTLFAMTQSRATNIPLFLLSHVQFRFLQSLDLSIPEITTSSLVLQHMHFFAFGGSNSIASVDLSSAYNGVEGFNVVAVGILTFVSNWAGAIYWVFCTSKLLAEHKQRNKLRSEGDGILRKNQPEPEPVPESAVLGHHLTLLTLFSTCTVGSVMAACMALRTHLFIWTVFSPKYLYCIAWGLGQHLIVNMGLGSILYWLGNR